MAFPVETVWRSGVETATAGRDELVPDLRRSFASVLLQARPGPVETGREED